MKEKFNKVHQHYKEFETFLLSKGIVPSRDTQLGHWGVTYLPALFKLLDKMDINKRHSFVDLGSGDGRVAFAAGVFSGSVKGVECDDWLHKSAHAIKAKLQDVEHVELHNANFMEHDISQYDYVYHSPDKPFYRGQLNQKLVNELKGKLIVHGWEYHPKGLTLDSEEVIDGEKFRIYSNPKHE